MLNGLAGKHESNSEVAAKPVLTESSIKIIFERWCRTWITFLAKPFTVI